MNIPEIMVTERGEYTVGFNDDGGLALVSTRETLMTKRINK